MSKRVMSDINTFLSVIYIYTCIEIFMKTFFKRNFHLQNLKRTINNEVMKFLVFYTNRNCQQEEMVIFKYINTFIVSALFKNFLK